MPLKFHTHAPSTFEEQTLPKEPEQHPSTQQEEQPCELTLPPEDPLQEEQDPEELPQAKTLNNLAPNLAEAIMLMTEQLRHRDPLSKKLRPRNLTLLMVLNPESSTTSFSFVISFSAAIPFTLMTLTR